ncbi:hypothetical protein [Paenibacillus herberti]|uniref:Uncharacterized protein n=1 Tax=Paenibacillus herberti TaxID=1619309 RepID=A0A229NVD4_9BACL|nr:hypothetical protein [Paenibacillus herberti]OXM13569.1 hypothetical protein CGZ75_21280 [Paenibacillus herberti]
MKLGIVLVLFILLVIVASVFCGHDSRCSGSSENSSFVLVDPPEIFSIVNATNLAFTAEFFSGNVLPPYSSRLPAYGVAQLQLRSSPGSSGDVVYRSRSIYGVLVAEVSFTLYTTEFFGKGEIRNIRASGPVVVTKITANELSIS